jgi:glucokinase
LGRFAGDLALIFQETGGVFLAGGIAPRIVNLLDGKFRQGFEDKSPFAKLMSTFRRLTTALAGRDLTVAA